MSFLTPLALIGGLLAIPIILLYMLRLRRREVLVSSTYLWQQIMQDSEANTPWQRLRRNLLLLLQLLILAALVIALARPFITVPALGAGTIVLLIDASASMNATDMDGRSRIAAARDEAQEIINTLGAGDEMTIIRVAGVAEVVAPATSDRLALRGAVEGIEASSARADWNGALTLALGGAPETGADYSVVIISDGGLGDPALLPAAPGEMIYVPVGRSGQNVGIAALATRALPGGPPQLFAQIVNHGDQDAEIIFSLTIDGALFSSQFYTIAAGDARDLVIDQLPPDFGVIEAGLTLPSGSTVPDYLALDNRAWAVAETTTTRSALLMTRGNLFLEQMLRSLPGIDAFRGDLNRGLPTRPFDLYIFDRWLPAELPLGDLLIIAPPASTPLFTVGPLTRGTTDARVNQADPRMTFVDFTNISILEFAQVTGADWATPLISAEGGSLLLAGEIEGRQVAILTFDLAASDLPLQITWPILMSNLLEWFTPGRIASIPGALSVGEALAIRPPLDADLLRITLPDGSVRDLPVARQVLFAETDQLGSYGLALLRGDEVIGGQDFAVNLFDPQESAIAPRATITLGGQTVAPETGEAVGQFEFWPYVALLGLLILLSEWDVYHRRLRVPTLLRPAPRRPLAGRA